VFFFHGTLIVRNPNPKGLDKVDGCTCYQGDLSVCNEVRCDVCGIAD